MGAIRKKYKILNSNVSPSAPFEIARILPDGKKIVKSMNEKSKGLTNTEVLELIKTNYPELNNLPD